MPLAFFLLYAFTAQRGVSWQDSGEFQLRILYQDYTHSGGIACVHPLYIWFGHWFCGILGKYCSIDLPLAANLMSGFWMALTLHVFYRTAQFLTGSVKAAILATLTLGFSHVVWWLSTIAEVYTMSLFFIACEIGLMVRILRGGEGRIWNWVALSVCMGLGFSIHNFSLISSLVTFVTLGVILIGEFKKMMPRHRIAIILSVALLTYFFLSLWQLASYPMWKLIKEAQLGGATFAEAIKSALVGEYGGEVMGGGRLSWKYWVMNMGISAFSLLMPCWWILLGKRPKIKEWDLAWKYVGGVFLVHALFFVRYRVPDQALFLLPTLLLAALFMAKKISQMTIRMPYTLVGCTVLAGILMPIMVNAVLHIGGVEKRILATRARLLPFRDEIRYWVIPWKCDETSAEDFAMTAIEKMDQKENDSYLYADSTSAPPIMLRLQEREKSWVLVTPWADESIFTEAVKARRDCYAVSPVIGYSPVKTQSLF